MKKLLLSVALLLPLSLRAGNLPLVNEASAESGRVLSAQARNAVPAEREDAQFAPFAALVPGRQPLVVPPAESGGDGQEKEYFFLNSNKQAALLMLPDHVVIPPTAGSLSAPLVIPGRHKAMLRLRWSKPLGVWWVETFLVAKVDLPPSPNLLAGGGGWSRMVQWDDATKLGAVSFRQGATTISVPAVQEFRYEPDCVAPSICTVPSFAGSLKGNWTLESKIRVGDDTGFHGKTGAAIGVNFADGGCIFALFEKDAGGRRVLTLNIHPYVDNLSIPFNSDVCYLRVIRKGTTYYIGYSSDGENWEQGPATISHPDDPSSAFVTVLAFAGKSEASYTFDYLTLTPERAGE